MPDRDDSPLYDVVINDEEQYSLWRADEQPPNGWRRQGTRGSKEACLAFIKEAWSDMRPLSLRKQSGR